MKRKRELPLDEVIRLFIQAAKRIKKDGGYVRMHLEFGPAAEAPSPAPGNNGDSYG